LNRFSEKYPYAILGDEFGILNESDLAINSCIAEPTPFSSKSISYPYWQCFQTKSTSFVCDYGGIQNKQTKLIQAALIININDVEHQEYISRRAIDLEDCESFKTDWKKITKNEPHVCLSGSFVNTKNNKGKREILWVFDKFKTKKGCISFFSNDCNFKARLKEGCVTSKFHQ
jgi:hypothetical protein